MVDPVLMEIIFVHAVQKALHGLQLRSGVLQLLPAELHAGGLLPTVGSADGRAVQTQRIAVYELHFPARAREDDEYLPDQLSVFLSEVRDGAEIRLQPVQQKPQFHISSAFPHELSGRADFVQIAVEIQLQQVAGMIRRTPRPRGHGVPEPQTIQLQTLYKYLDEPRRALPRHLILHAPHAHRHLTAVPSHDIPHQIPSMSNASHIYIIRHVGRKSFWFLRFFFVGASGVSFPFSDILTTVRPKTQFSDGYFIPFIQKPPIQGPKSRKKEGFPPQISAISLIFGIAILR